MEKGDLHLGVFIINPTVTYYSTWSQAVVAHPPSLAQQLSGNTSVPDHNSAKKDHLIKQSHDEKPQKADILESQKINLLKKINKAHKIVLKSH